jgi:hypothetical protein
MLFDQEILKQKFYRIYAYFFLNETEYLLNLELF